MDSRNKREGKYRGKCVGHHFRYVPEDTYYVQGPWSYSAKKKALSKGFYKIRNYYGQHK